MRMETHLFKYLFLSIIYASLPADLCSLLFFYNLRHKITSTDIILFYLKINY